MVTVFWSSLAILAFTYGGYPVLMAMLARVRLLPIRRGRQTPRVDVLLVVHNGASHLEAKLSNLLALDYPSDRLRILVVCDGCTDGTEAIARRHSSERVEVLAFGTRRGKSRCIDDALAHLLGDVVAFTDVRQLLDPQAIRALVSPLADPHVGAVSGELMLASRNGYGAAIGAYWRYEKMVRRLESASGSIVGVTGALYAIRREALESVPAGLILDDMWIPLAIADAGYRVVFEPNAIAHDLASADHVAEEIRKRRTLCGNYQLLHQWPRLAIPGGHPLAWRLWGHKWLRLLAPWLLLLALASNVALVNKHGFYAVTLLLQLAVYGLALLGRRYPTAVTGWMPARLATAFVSLHLSALLALGDYLRNRQAHLWSASGIKEARP